MTETPSPPPTPLTDQTLQRLRKLASGNGLEPQDIVVVETDERVYTFEGRMTFTPLCEVEHTRYPGAPKGNESVKLPTYTALQMEVDRQRDEFKDSTDWIPKVIEELKTEPGDGWGLNDAKVTLAGKSSVMTATESCQTCQGRQVLTCEQCQGQGEVICTTCQGRGREHCYHCMGSGQEPNQPDQACMVCNRSLEAPCRFCQSRGRLPCPTCHGNRGIRCTGCNGTGSITEAIALTCGASTRFQLIAEGLPSGMRRGFDRLGIVNLTKGHADIESIAPEPEENTTPDPDGAPMTPKEPEPVLNYRVTMPYADIKLRFGNSRVKLVGAFGKRCSLLNVPPFLDEALQPWREKLDQAARGNGPIEPAIEVRALREALSLHIRSKGQVKELRRLYSVGLSTEVMQEIFTNLRRALNRFTLHHRTLIAVLGGTLSTALFFSVFLTSLHQRLTENWSHGATTFANFALLISAMLLSWLALGYAARISLKKRFPNLTVPFQQETGKTGYTMLAGIAVAWGLAVYLGGR